MPLLMGSLSPAGGAGGGGGIAGQILRFDFLEGSGTTLNGYTPLDGMTWGSDAFGTFAQFNVGSGRNFIDSASLPSGIAASKDFTSTCWALVPAFGTGTTNGLVQQMSPSNASLTGGAIYRDGSATDGFVYIDAAGTRYKFLATPFNNILTHWVWRKTGAVFDLFANNVKVFTTAVPDDDCFPTGEMKYGTAFLAGTNPAAQFYDAALYNRALDDLEIAALFAAGRAY